MGLSDIEFGDLESLSRIDLEDDERDRLRLQLGRMLEYFGRLGDIDTEGGSDNGHYGQAPSEDAAGECLDRDEVLSQAPDSSDGFFRVPPVIERGGGEGE